MKTRASVAAALVSAVLALPARAQGAQDSMSVRGTLVSTGNVSIAVRTDEGEVETFIVDTQTSMPGEKLAAGERVRVRYKRLGATRFLAIAVTRLDPGPGEEAPEGAHGDGRAAVRPTLRAGSSHPGVRAPLRSSGER